MGRVVTATDEIGAGKCVDVLPSREVARPNPHCFACGKQNADGLRLEFEVTQQGVRAVWQPLGAWNSFQGVVHGGIVSTVLDEAMSKAVIEQGCEAFTVDMRIRFRRIVRPGGWYEVRGWVVDQHKRRIRAEAILQARDKAECAHAWASFMQARSR